MRFIVRFDRSWDEDGAWVGEAVSVPAHIRNWANMVTGDIRHMRQHWQLRFIRYEYMADGSGSRFYYIIHIPEAHSVVEATDRLRKIPLEGTFQVLFAERG